MTDEKNCPVLHAVGAGSSAPPVTPRDGTDRVAKLLTLLLAIAALYTIYFARELLLPITAAYFLKLVLISG